MINFNASELLSAYKKLKHYFYYDNTSLFIRAQIADFEEKIIAETKSTKVEEKITTFFSNLAKKISSMSINEWKKHFEENIQIRVTVKTLEKPSSKILTNTNGYSEINLLRSNHMIDTSVETHIISVLWLMYVGKYLSKLVDIDSYAYKLELKVNFLEEEQEEVVNGLKLYKPYFKEYQNWRDNAITKVEKLFEEKKDSVLLSLDIKDYYHNAIFKFSELKKMLYENNSDLKLLDNSRIERLFRLLSLIHEVYYKKLVKQKTLPILGKNESILPIGLLSSGLISNLVLRDFDRKIKEELNPAYYGRYVDDILVVLTNVVVSEKSISPVNVFLNKYFVQRGLLEFNKLPKKLKNSKSGLNSSYKEPELKNLDNNEYYSYEQLANEVKFHLTINKNLVIQANKVVLQNFNSIESPAIINKFKKNIEKNRSEFRFLPEEEKIESDFEEEAFYIHYNDSINKIRSIKEFSEDKYGASKYLAGKIFVASYTNEKPDEKTINQILTFFKGRLALNFYTLWEKVATYFIITEQKHALIKFILQCEKSINAIKDSRKEEKSKGSILNSLKRDMQDYLYLAISTSLALHPQYLTQKDLSSTQYKRIFYPAIKLRKANLLRHQLLEIPVLNYTKISKLGNYTFNLLKSHESLRKHSSVNLDGHFEFSDELLLLSPRYVHYHEITIFQSFKVVNEPGNNDNLLIQNIEELNKSSFVNYWKINHGWKVMEKDPELVKHEIELKQKSYFEIFTEEVNNTQKVNYITIADSNDNVNENKLIALASVKINSTDIKSSYLGKPNTSKKRRELFFKLLNLVEESGADMLILPEVSIPFKWMTLLASQSQKRNLGFIAGLEHWINSKKIAFNFIATFLPINRKGFRTCFMRLRLKNHYSPEEIKNLKGYRLLIPSEVSKACQNQYDLFHWQKVYFSVYNCYELANIKDRGLFKGKVDFIIASEYNKDTNYFSEIAGSWVRDIHTFFIQVNTSDYGDSRIIQPSKTEIRDIIRIKGGENSTIVVGILPVKDLRDFQLKEYDLQKEDARFKSTPPDFNRSFVETRINNHDFGVAETI